MNYVVAALAHLTDFWMERAYLVLALGRLGRVHSLSLSYADYPNVRESYRDSPLSAEETHTRAGWVVDDVVVTLRDVDREREWSEDVLHAALADLGKVRRLDVLFRDGRLSGPNLNPAVGVDVEVLSLLGVRAFAATTSNAASRAYLRDLARSRA